MVLNPEKAVELTQEQDKNVSILEKIIDNVLEKEFDPKNPSKQIRVEVRIDLEPKVEQGLQRMYKTAGWNIQIYSEIGVLSSCKYFKLSKPD